MPKTRMVSLLRLLVCILVSGSASAQYFSHSYAIVVGIDTYQSSASFPTLHYAIKDAQVMASYLASQGFTVIPLYGRAANRSAIISAMQDQLAPKLGHDDRVLVFFSGHGTTETLGGVKRGYIVPYDGSNSSSLISMEELRALSSYMGSAKHQLFIMDSCYGGVLAASTRESVVSPYVAHYLQQVTDRIARQVLTAGGEGQTVLDGGPKGHSVFVDALLEGLQDGLADRDGDGYITFHELVAYVTPRAANDYQTPDPGVLPGDQGGEFLFRNPKGAGRAVVEIPAPVDTRRRSSNPLAEAQQYVALGNTREGVSDWDGAADQYRGAIRVYPDYAEAHMRLGVVLSRREDVDGSLREEREAIRLKPDDADAHESYGAALIKKGDINGAVLEEREAIRLKSNHSEAHGNLGVALRLKGDLDGSIRETQEAIRLNPNDALAHESLGFAFEQKGDKQAAVAEYRRALEIQPDDLQLKVEYDKALDSINSRQKSIFSAPP